MRANTTFLRILLVGFFFSSNYSDAQSIFDWGTYYGGGTNDFGQAVANDPSGNVIVVGNTQSISGMASSGAWQISYGGGTSAGGDAFVAKFSNTGNRLWGTYFGGIDNEQATAVATDNVGNVYVAGWTKSTSGISTTGSHQPAMGGNEDAFLAKFSAVGTLVWATYYGGSGNDRAYAVCTDTNGNIFVAGQTRSAADIATTSAFQTSLASTNADDGFLVKFNSNGVRQWGTYWGGAGSDILRAAATDLQGNVYISGYATAASISGIASAGAFQGSFSGGASDGIVAKFSAAGSRIWSTYYGGPGTDQTKGLCVNDSGNVFVAGITTSTSGIATTGSHQDTYGGGISDAFLVKLDSTGQRQWATYYGGPLLDEGNAVACDAYGRVYLAGTTLSVAGIATPGINQDTLQMRDAYVARFDMGGQRLWGTYAGGSDLDYGIGLSYDDAGNVYITGQTNSAAGLASPGAFQTQPGGAGYYDAWLMKLADCPVPLTPQGIFGDTIICGGGSYIFSTPALTQVQDYTWSLPSSWSTIGSITGDSLHVLAGAGAATTITDTIRIHANYLCGSSLDTMLVVKIAPKASLTPTGLQHLCSGDTGTLFATTAFVNNWQWLKDGALIIGTDSMLQVSQPGVYQVITTNAACTDTSTGDTTVVHPLPQPVISMNGNSLTTGSYPSYQWYHNGTVIIGATNQSYTMITMTGTYSVEVTDTNGCSGMSADYIPLAVTDLLAHPEIFVYPNPVNNMLTITSPYELGADLFSVDGKLLQQCLKATEIDMSHYAGGLYFLRFRDSKGVMICERKVIKQ